MMHPGWTAWGGVGGTVGLLLALSLTVLAAVALTRVLLPRPPASDRHRPDTALDVLRTRFASGEIDEAEYLHRRATLSNPERGAQP